GLRDEIAFSTAVAATRWASMSAKVSPSLQAQPLPVPSGVRAVAVIVTTFVASYANRPFEFANAVAPARHSMNPVAIAPALRACSVTTFAAAARSVGVGSEMV